MNQNKFSFLFVIGLLFALLSIVVDAASIWKRENDYEYGGNNGYTTDMDTGSIPGSESFGEYINYTQLSAEESFKQRSKIFEEGYNTVTDKPWEPPAYHGNEEPYKPPKEEAFDLRVFHAGENMTDLCTWYGTTFEEVDPETAIEQLRDELCNRSMDMDPGCYYFNYALSRPGNQVDGLNEAEALTVRMYTGNFYNPYNELIRLGVLDRYKVYTSLFFNALKKLDTLYPVPVNTTLYRGMSRRFKTPESKRIHFKQFVSTSTERRVAEGFGTNTFMIFEPPISIIAAPVQNLSYFPFEAEVLISPFEVFELIRRENNTMYFRSAKKQELLDNDLLSCPDLVTSGSAVSTAMFLPWLLVAMVTGCHGYWLSWVLNVVVSLP